MLPDPWGDDDGRMLIRAERPTDVAAVRAVTAAAFREAAHAAPPVEADGAPGEATLVTWLRADPAWIPELSLVAEANGEIVGHVLCTRGDVSGVPALGLGPLSVHPSQQGRGVGTALVHAVLEEATALGEHTVVLLGDPAYYVRFGFVPATAEGIDPPVAEWAPYFQALRLTPGGPRGTFSYAAPFGRLG